MEPKEINDFDQLINESSSLHKFIDVSKKLGGPLEGLAANVKDAFVNHRNLIHYGLHNTEPGNDSVIMQRFLNSVKLIVEYKENAKEVQFVNHFATVKTSIVALGWISVKPAPAEYVKEMRQAGEYYSNRVLSTFKGQPDHLQWVQNYQQCLMDLQQFVRNTFLTGFTWGAAANRQRSPFTLSSLPPPPPPPPPPAFGDDLAAGDGARIALMNDLNKGADIVRNLRPVKRDVNAGPTVTPRASRPQPTTVKPASVLPPPRHLLEGRKWVVEFFKNQDLLPIRIDDMTQSVSIYKCDNSKFQVNSKVNSVTIDASKKTTVFLQDVISGLTLINCVSCEIQLQGNTPIVSLDNCDSIQIFVTSESRKIEVISAKSTSCNICLYMPDGDYKEMPIPEQIKTVIKDDGKSLLSSIIEKY